MPRLVNVAEEKVVRARVADELVIAAVEDELVQAKVEDTGVIVAQSAEENMVTVLVEDC